MIRSLYLAALPALMLASSPALAQEPSAGHAIYAEADDAELNAAIKTARESLPTFWSHYEKRAAGDGPFLLKVSLPTRDKSLEYIWMVVTARSPEITGVLANIPVNIDGVSRGSTVTVTEKQITDWSYFRGGIKYGLFTDRVLAKRVSPEERAAIMAGFSPTPIEGQTP